MKKFAFIVFNLLITLNPVANAHGAKLVVYPAYGSNLTHFNEGWQHRKTDVQLMQQKPPFTPDANDPLAKLFKTQLVDDTSNIRYPYRTAGYLAIHDAQKGDSACSASVINKRLILTAAHCLYNQNGWQYSEILFIPAFRNGFMPYGAWKIRSSIIPTEWAQHPAPPNSNDFAILEAEDQAPIAGGQAVKLGNVVGSLGLETGIPNAKQTFNQLAYSKNFFDDELMILSTSYTRDERYNDMLVSVNNLSKGSSGSPWIINFCSQRSCPTDANRVVATASAKQEGQTKFAGGQTSAAIFGATFIEMFYKMCARRAGNCDSASLNYIN